MAGRVSVGIGEGVGTSGVLPLPLREGVGGGVAPAECKVVARVTKT